MRSRPIRILAATVLTTAALAAGFLALARPSAANAPAAPAPAPVDYNRDIRPILSDNCYACHGPDEAKRKAKLRLDRKADALAEMRSGGFAILPGDVGQSEIIARITAEDPEERMPPVKSGKTLTPAQIDLLQRWIEQGAPWEEHWAYRKIQRPPLPEVSDHAWPRNPIDHFILARLESEKLTAAPETDRITLLRRLSFDLVGLPPALEEVDAFLADQSPQAYERAVERLLDSHHFGERMAIHWLDLVRYGDSIGYHSDNPMHVSPYRDYVIKAFNDNKPFDRFTIEQLAGDLLPEPGLQEKVASAYNRLLMTTEEGGAQPREYTAKYAADRVRNASAVWLGSTMGCAECHDHKFDPFTMKDFYSLAAFFADVKEAPVGKREPGMPVPDEKQAAQLARLDEGLTRLRIEFEAPSAELAADQANWERDTRSDLLARRTAWTPVKPVESSSTAGVTLALQDDLSLLATGPNPDTDTYTVTLPASDRPITAIRLEALPDPSFPGKGLSRGNGNFVLTEVKVELAADEDLEPVPVRIASAAADYAQNGHPIERAIDGKPDTGWAVDGNTRKEQRTAIFIFEQPVSAAPGAILTIRLKHEFAAWPKHIIGRFRLSLTNVPNPPLSETAGLPKDVVAALDADPAERDDKQREALARHYRTIALRLAPLRDEIARLEAEKKALLETIPTTLITLAAEPRTMRILGRGNWLDDSGTVVQPAIPEFLGALSVDARRPTRLDLAHWLISPDNPLTARVVVNRLWSLFFASALSRIADDFGAQGEAPSHPELLDWLAAEFIDSGWDVKHVVRLIVTSSAYRQSSRSTPALRERDPDNRLLARQSRFRLDAEFVRDNALAVSGLLVRNIGGPSVKPYQPAGYWDFLNFPKRTYEHDRGQSQYRRGLYTHWQRTFLHPSLKAFDAPTREECTAQRIRSNIPQQALTLLNDPTYVEAARVLAERTIRDGGATADQRIAWAFRRALSRPPVEREAAVLTELLEKHLQHYQRNQESARKLITAGESPVPTDLDPAELAAWTSITRAILNLHEVITRP